jgi:hypothetical protein
VPATPSAVRGAGPSLATVAPARRLAVTPLAAGLPSAGRVAPAWSLRSRAVATRSTNRDRFHRYRLEVQPKAFLLDLTRRSRVYQQLSAVDIARKLLDEHKLAAELAVDTATLKAQDQPVLAYTVQYEETDLAFLTRILAESGLWWTLIHQAESTGLVIGADPHGFADLQAGGDKRLVSRAREALRRGTRWLMDLTAGLYRRTPHCTRPDMPTAKCQLRS